jgi:hypothetical protein
VYGNRQQKIGGVVMSSLWRWILLALLLAQSAVMQGQTALSAITERFALDARQAQLIAGHNNRNDAASHVQTSSASPKSLALDQLQAALNQGLRPGFEFIEATPTKAWSADISLANQCARAWLLASEQAFLAQLDGNSSIWFRVPVPAHTQLILDTVGSHADTALQLFAGCDANAVLGSADDEFGLQSRLLLPRAAHDRVYFAKLASLSLSKLPLRLRLLAGASVSGRITRQSDGTPLYAAAIFFDELKRYVGSSFSELTTGNYTLAVPADIPKIYLRTQKIGSTATWLNSVYPNGLCRDQQALDACQLSNALLLDTPANSNQVLAPLALREGAVLRGSVSVPAGEFAYVEIKGLTRQGLQLFSGASDSVGRYTLRGLFPEPVLVYARGSTVLPAVHPNLMCSGPNPGDCPLAQATAVNLDLDSPSEVNFALQRSSGLQLQLGLATSTSVDVFRADGTFLLSTWSQSNFIALPPGGYRLRFRSSGFFAQVWPNVDCIFPCFDGLAIATPLALAVGEIRTLDLNFRPLPTIRVRLRERDTQSPVMGSVALLDGSNNAWAYANASPSGDAFLSNIEAGQYFLFANSRQHVDQAYPGVPCLQITGFNQLADCPGSQSFAIDLSTPAMSDVDFTLDRSATISGALNYSTMLSALSSNGQYLFGAYANTNNGRYRIEDMLPGTYKLGVADGRIFSQLFRGLNCAVATTDFGGCNFASAEIVTLASGEQRNDIDFTPRMRQAIRGVVTSLETGAPLGNIIIDLWRRQTPAGAITIFSSVRTDANGRFEVTAFAPAYLSTDNAEGHVEQVYPQIQCPAGSAASGACNIALGQMVEPIDAPNGGEIIIRLRDATSFQNGFEE